MFVFPLRHDEKRRKVRKILGPRKLMPNPKSGTVTMDIEKTVRDIKGRLEFRIDKYGVIHCSIGRISFDIKQLAENYAALIDAVIKQSLQLQRKVY